MFARAFRGAPLSRVMVTMTLACAVLARAFGGGERARAWIFDARGGHGETTSARRSPSLTTLAASFARRWVCARMAFCVDAFELVLGLSALADGSRWLERACGTRRFAGIVCACAMVCEACDAFVRRSFAKQIMEGSVRASEVFIAGPYALTFALTWIWALESTSSSRVPALGGLVVVPSDKMGTYVKVAMLALKGGVPGARSALIGLFAGYVVTHGVGLLNEALVFPEAVADALRGGSKAQAIIRVRADVPNATTRDVGGGAVRPPSEENIRLLASMGFDVSAATRALTQSNDDVARATTILLGE